MGGLLVVSGASLPADAARPGSWRWPVSAPLIVEPYDPPATRYGAGHRGVDLAAAVGSSVVAPADGVISFAGTVGDRPVLSVAHGSGLVSSYEPVAAVASVGTAVHAGETIGTIAAAPAHCSDGCLHFGVRRDGEYLSPVGFIDGIPRAVLLPIGGGWPRSAAR
ncbi:M23 family metallopeptidase [Naasia lichenicola]|uniref:M23 family metallopeptidase n=2 Tax=Naasia lichenicola TaxID=2565933 RepID=A0A4S4FNK4_9MICO|nr:M23 family metallopeptidase [Naasia lichenicola]